MARLPIAARNTIPEKQRRLFDEMVAERGAVPRYGPGSVLIHVPAARLWEQGLTRYIRDESCLTRKIKELAMLITARELDCQYIWNAHAPSARKAGVSDALVDALRENQNLPALADDENAVVRYGREYFRTHRVSDEAFQAAQEQFGDRGVIELSLVMGNYSMLALLTNSFDADLPPNRNEPLLPV